MSMLELVFWLVFGLILFIYIGYALLIGLSSKLFPKPPTHWANTQDLPSVCIIIPAFNEATCLNQKVFNTLALDYPSEKLKIIVITDGSSDGSETLTWGDERVIRLHQPQREGKSAAINRAMPFSDAEITAITDANTLLNSDALLALTSPFQSNSIGGVAGEKRVQTDFGNSTSNEGLYWKYESRLKRWDAQVYSIVGAAGELFAFRTHLFQPLEIDAILDDFMLSVRIVEQGYRVGYAPNAQATESASPSLSAEWKRKIRIAAGVFQSLPRLDLPLKPSKYPLAWAIFVGHRWMRWMLAPPLLLILLPLHLNLGLSMGGLWLLFAFIHLSAYILAGLGFALNSFQLKIPFFYTPMYFVMMNAAMVAGAFRFFSGKQSVLWEKVRS